MVFQAAFCLSACARAAHPLFVVAGLRLKFLHRLLHQLNLAGVFAAVGANHQVQAQGEAFAAGERPIGALGDEGGDLAAFFMSAPDG